VYAVLTKRPAAVASLDVDESCEIGETIRYQLRRLRRLRGLTQEELADRADVSRDLVAKLEQGRRQTARITSLASLARALNVELSALVARPAPVVEGVASDREWRASPEMAADLETLLGSYRQAYGGKASVAELLPSTAGLMCLLIDLQRRGQWPENPARLASLVGQSALLVGVLHLMGPRHLEASRAHYDLALQAAREGEDWDLASYVLGSLAFLAMSADRTSESREFRDAAWELASRRASPRMRAWTAALASELYARDGDEASSRRLLNRAFAAMERTRADPGWKGVGWFDTPRLAAYEGGNLVLLGRYAAAEKILRGALSQLDPARVKHRCTLSADLATSLVGLGEIEEASVLAIDALSLARSIAHQESIERVRSVHAGLLPWREHGTVRALTEQLQAH
jgi:transcriptional regulator with XRE-family HTH domain